MVESSLIPAVAVEVIATVSGVIVSIGIPLVLTKLNKINKLHTTVFGLQEVSTVGGLVDTVQSNEQLAEKNREKIEDLEKSQSRTEDKIDELIDYVKDDEQT